jgi:hypothetical protein
MDKNVKPLADEVPIDISDAIQVHMVFNGPRTRGWVHTHGMFEVFGLPDLEIREVNPLMLMPAAGQLLVELAQYMVDGLYGRRGAKPYKLGQTIDMGRGIILTTKMSTPIDPKNVEEVETHFKNPRYLVYQANSPKCECCNGETHEKGSES